MTITLTRSGTEPASYTVGGQPRALWPLHLEAAITGTGVTDGGAFVYQAGETDAAGDVCVAVASAAQYRLLKLGRGNRGDSPYYRETVGFFFCLSAEEATETYAKIVSDMRQLARDWDHALSLDGQTIVTITPSQVGVALAPGVESRMARTVISSDGSKLLVYNAAGVLIAEVPMLTPS